MFSVSSRKKRLANPKPICALDPKYCTLSACKIVGSKLQCDYTNCTCPDIFWNVYKCVNAFV